MVPSYTFSNYCWDLISKSQENFGYMKYHIHACTDHVYKYIIWGFRLLEGSNNRVQWHYDGICTEKNIVFCSCSY